jgi:NAD(P)-dependent dehydrogenase (short-subunit alcohol dehydrogenase family)
MKRTILVIGGTGGIGKAVAFALAKQGNDFIIQGRDIEKGKTIVAEISKLNGSTATFIAADMHSVESIKNLAAEIKKLTTKIDIAIYSSGTLNSVRKESKDGLDEGFLVNYLNKFMLDTLLLEELKRGEGRIIIVGAPLMKNAAINFDDLHSKNNYALFKAMGQAMLAVHMHVQEFAKRNGAHPSINVINPGVVKSGIDRNVTGFLKVMLRAFGPLISNSSEKAVVNIMELATTKNIESGYFYPKVAKPEAKVKVSLDAATATKLWDESLNLAKL